MAELKSITMIHYVGNGEMQVRSKGKVSEKVSQLDHDDHPDSTCEAWLHTNHIDL